MTPEKDTISLRGTPYALLTRIPGTPSRAWCIHFRVAMDRPRDLFGERSDPVLSSLRQFNGSSHWPEPAESSIAAIARAPGELYLNRYGRLSAP